MSFRLLERMFIMKYILIIGDGMADNPVQELGGKTPLEHANIPVMDDLAHKGVLGSTINCPEGLPPGSDTAILSIFVRIPRSVIPAVLLWRLLLQAFRLNPAM